MWLALREEGAEFSLEWIDEKDVQAGMVDYAMDKFLLNKLIDRRKSTILDERELAWIGNDPRLINWLSHQINDISRPYHLDLPASISPRDSFFLRIDSWDNSVDNKIRYIDRLKSGWAQLQAEDKYFSWLKRDKKEKLRCGAAWDWYQEEHSRTFYGIPRFQNLGELFLFLDTSEFRLDEKRYHLEQIKRELKRRESLDRLKNKAQTNFALSKDVRRQLDNLVDEQQQTMVAVIERLIRHASEHGMPDESIRERFTDSNKQ